VGLVAAFKSTLSVVAQATLILNVVDASADDFEDQMEITAKILTELCPAEVPRVTVFNKIDLIPEERLEFLKSHHPQTIFISAEGKIGLDVLKGRIRDFYDQAKFAEAVEEHATAPNLGWETPAVAEAEAEKEEDEPG
jgi:GTPase